MPDKVDYKRELKPVYSAKAGQPVLVEVPLLHFLMVDGIGDPNTARAYSEAVEALFSVAYTLKFAVKKAQAFDFAVMPLEGQWWVDDPTQPFYHLRDQWHWTAMIMQPDIVTESMFDAARQAVVRKKNLPALEQLRLGHLHEGQSAQVLHAGPFSEEPATIEALHGFIEAQGCVPTGRHHEIYLSDPLRTAPEKLKTILRQPVAGRGP